LIITGAPLVVNFDNHFDFNACPPGSDAISTAARINYFGITSASLDITLNEKVTV